MKRAHLKLWKALLAGLVCLFVAVHPLNVYAETVVSASVSIDIIVELEGDQSVPYQYVDIDEDSGYLWRPDVEEGWMPSEEGESPPGGYWVPVGLWGSVAGKGDDAVRAEFGQLEGTAANSIGVEFSWSEIATGRNSFSWGEYDALLRELKERGLKAFMVIKLDQAPSWFADLLIEDGVDLYSHYPPGPAIDVRGFTRISYTHPDAVEYAQDFVRELVSRYAVGGECEDLAPVVAGWIVDAGEGYVDRDEGTYIGYEENSVEAFKLWLETNGDYLDVIELNDKWGTTYPGPGFEDVEMPVPFDEEGEFIVRDDPGWCDLLKWRKEVFKGWMVGILGAVREAEYTWTEGDIIHLVSVLTPGSEPGDSDYLYSSVDIEAIATQCRDFAIPIDFWSITSTPSFTEDDEAVSTQWELVRTQAMTDNLPVLVLQMNYEEDEDEDIADQQERILKSNIWELIFGGAIGVHLYDGEDVIATDGTSMEVLGGITDGMANLNEIVVTNELDEVMVVTDLMGYLLDSNTPPPEVGFLRTDAQDTIYNRAETEIYSLYGALKRLGFQMGFINDIYRIDDSYKSLILPRNQKMENSDLNPVLDELENVLVSGIKLHANADLPGMLDEYGASRHEEEGWIDYMKHLFGVDPEGVELDTDLEDDLAVGGYESPSTELRFDSQGLESELIGYSGTVEMWKYRNGLDSTFDADVIATFSDDGSPALIMKANETAISLFSLGGSKGTDEDNTWGWQERCRWLELIYKNEEVGFRLGPEMGMNLTGSPYVSKDCRMGPEGSILIYLHNYKDELQIVTLESPDLLDKKIIKLIPEGESEYTEGGRIAVSVGPQDEVFLLATLALPPAPPEPEWIPPDPEPVVPDPGPVAPDPGPVVPDPGPVVPDTGPVVSDTGPVNPDPEPEPTTDTPTTSNSTGSYQVVVLEGPAREDIGTSTVTQPDTSSSHVETTARESYMRTTVGSDIVVSKTVREAPRSISERTTTRELAPVLSGDEGDRSSRWQTSTMKAREPVTHISYPTRRPQFRPEPAATTQKPAEMPSAIDNPILRHIVTAIQRAVDFIDNLGNIRNRPIILPALVRKVSKYVVG